MLPVWWHPALRTSQKMLNETRKTSCHEWHTFSLSQVMWAACSVSCILNSCGNYTEMLIITVESRQSRPPIMLKIGIQTLCFGRISGCITLVLAINPEVQIGHWTMILLGLTLLSMKWVPFSSVQFVLGGQGAVVPNSFRIVAVLLIMCVVLLSLTARMVDIIHCQYLFLLLGKGGGHYKKCMLCLFRKQEVRCQD